MVSDQRDFQEYDGSLKIALLVVVIVVVFFTPVERANYTCCYQCYAGKRHDPQARWSTQATQFKQSKQIKQIKHKFSV
jgi:hypothetical protein